ncbi:hypothetical protein JX266_005160 [Neoarthrinium moseri]|uniref:uncharacterized protein n=1 Tax=Neoarthrinium moseri TaxID=1658444 RepID=UPI001FDBB635|nr:uncharacterized protein JN550_006494 [Neoarthrinium moseri]KAI1849199.1 hypothetical protein JX266_005160 [Neoarthrinium moseri]KAI1868578.1 hypothetical protein JN550_006494 [Neoarthrinium moseri]
MSATSSKPVILLIHGGWHYPKCYGPLVDELEGLGYSVLCPELPTLGADTHGKTPADDVALIHEIVLPLFDQGKEIVIIGHSYGGIPACASTQGLGVQERALEGKKGGFKSIVFLAAFAIPKRGMDLLQTFGGSWGVWQNATTPYTRNQLITVNDNAKHAFYNDMPDDESQKWFDTLVPHSQDAFETGVDYVAADLTIPKGYVICELDQVSANYDLPIVPNSRSNFYASASLPLQAA